MYSEVFPGWYAEPVGPKNELPWGQRMWPTRTEAQLSVSWVSQSRVTGALVDLRNSYLIVGGLDDKPKVCGHSGILSVCQIGRCYIRLENCYFRGMKKGKV